MSRIAVPPLGRWALCADWLMRPVMRLLSGAIREEPQRTHRWNNRRLNANEIASLNRDLMVVCPADPGAQPFRPVFFHLPLFGGWRKYVVIEPLFKKEGGWHIGWLTDHANGVSRVNLDGPARVLLGPAPVAFFGVDVEGKQIIIRCIGEGVIGDGSAYSQMPLL